MAGLAAEVARWLVTLVDIVVGNVVVTEVVDSREKDSRLLCFSVKAENGGGRFDFVLISKTEEVVDSVIYVVWRSRR